jgi:flavodoxin
MAAAIIYYSFGGRTERWARGRAEKTGAELIRVTEKRGRSKLGSFFGGCPQAARGAASEIVWPGGADSADGAAGADLSGYDEITVAGPIWAGHVAPAVNAIIGALPQGKTVTLVITSNSGQPTEPKAEERIRARGCTLKETVAVRAKDIG